MAMKIQEQIYYDRRCVVVMGLGSGYSKCDSIIYRGGVHALRGIDMRGHRMEEDVMIRG
jgi:hypothetical protein